MSIGATFFLSRRFLSRIAFLATECISGCDVGGCELHAHDICRRRVECRCGASACLRSRESMASSAMAAFDSLVDGGRITCSELSKTLTWTSVSFQVEWPVSMGELSDSAGAQKSPRFEEPGANGVQVCVLASLVPPPLVGGEAAEVDRVLRLRDGAVVVGEAILSADGFTGANFDAAADGGH